MNDERCDSNCANFVLPRNERNGVFAVFCKVAATCQKRVAAVGKIQGTDQPDKSEAKDWPCVVPDLKSV